MPSAANGWAGQPPPTWQQGYGPQGTARPARPPQLAARRVSGLGGVPTFISLIAGVNFYTPHPPVLPGVSLLLFPKI